MRHVLIGELRGLVLMFSPIKSIRFFQAFFMLSEVAYSFPPLLKVGQPLDAYMVAVLPVRLSSERDSSF